jgi:crotonobetainyl-CoA:carnitine CoA-transferase CaiB-like acyl-CoA transferase
VSDAGSTGGGTSGIRVVECGSGVAAAYAAKLLADVGADVIKVEPPGGDVTRQRGPFRDDRPDPEGSGLFAYLNTNKRGTTADLTTPEGRALLAGLLASADIVVHDVPPAGQAALGLDAATLTAAHPALVVASISVFGDTGPHAHWKGYELTASNAGGWAFLSPGASPYPELPPLKAFGAQCEYTGGAYAALASLAAYRHRLKTGAGQAVDVSEQEAVACMLEMNLMHWTYAGRETSRLGTRAVGPWFIGDCADGKVFALSVEEAQWERLVEFMGNPDWAGEEIFADRVVRGQNADVLQTLMSDWVASFKVQDLYRAAQERRIPFAPVNTTEMLYGNEHLAARAYFVRHEQPGMGTLTLPGRPSQYGRTSWSLRRPAPRLGEHAAEIAAEAARGGAAHEDAGARARPVPADVGAPGGVGPLAGVRVLDFCAVWAGPFGTQNLAHLGADVIRIETTSRVPCITRLLPPFADDEPGPGRAGYYNQYNQGKRSILLNFSKPEAVELAHELAKVSDVVTDNFSAGIMQKLHCGYEQMRAAKADIIQISMSGYGQYGPFRAYLGYGPPASALSGLFSASGYAGLGPSEIGVSYPDPNAGLMGAYAVMVALLHRDATGEGQYIDQSQWEAMLAHMPEALLEWDLNRREPVRKGNHDAVMAPHETYKAQGDADQWVSIAVGTDAEFRALCAVMGQPDLADDPRFAHATDRKKNEAALDELVTAWTSVRDKWAVTEELQAAGVAAYPSLSNKGLTEDPHLLARDYFVNLEHATIGRRTHAGIPWRMSATPCAIRSAAPLAGAHTDEVLGSLLGLSAAELDRLRGADVLL